MNYLFFMLFITISCYGMDNSKKYDDEAIRLLNENQKKLIEEETKQAMLWHLMKETGYITYGSRASGASSWGIDAKYDQQPTPSKIKYDKEKAQ